MEPYNDFNDSSFPTRSIIKGISPIKNRSKANGISYVINPIDSYSELYKNSKNKGGKVIIEKPENQIQKLKKSYIIKKKARCDSNLKNGNRTNRNIATYLQIGTNKRRYHVSNEKNNSMLIGESRYNNRQNEYNNDNNEIYDDNYRRKNKDIVLYPKRNDTLYDNYKELIKLKTFRKLTKNNNNNINNAFRKYTKVNSHPDLNKKIVKIQSLWRGTYFRMLMGFYWNIDSFVNMLDAIFKSHIYTYFFDFVKNLTYFPKKNKDEKESNDFQLALSKKEEDYNNLLEKYNALIEKCNELEKNNSNQNKNNLIKEEKRIKKFDIIKIEQKDKFDIINLIDNNKPVKLREKYKNKKKETYQSYIERFTSNLQKIKNETLMIKENKKTTVNNNNKNNNELIKEKILIIENQKNMNMQIKQKKKKRHEKMTEITSELNQIIPFNNNEFFIEGIIKKNKYINNKEQELEIINSKKNIIYNNINLEVDNKETLEINPYTIKKSDIKKENDIEILFNKYAFYTGKAKDNIMKIILPIKFKIILKEFAFRYVINLLSGEDKENMENNEKNDE